jgi:hypothetical protein
VPKLSNDHLVTSNDHLGTLVTRRFKPPPAAPPSALQHSRGTRCVLVSNLGRIGIPTARHWRLPRVHHLSCSLHMLWTLRPRSSHLNSTHHHSPSTIPSSLIARRFCPLPRDSRTFPLRFRPPFIFVGFIRCGFAHPLRTSPPSKPVAVSPALSFRWFHPLWFRPPFADLPAFKASCGFACPFFSWFCPLR